MINIALIKPDSIIYLERITNDANTQGAKYKVKVIAIKDKNLAGFYTTFDRMSKTYPKGIPTINSGYFGIEDYKIIAIKKQSAICST